MRCCCCCIEYIELWRGAKRILGQVTYTRVIVFYILYFSPKYKEEEKLRVKIFALVFVTS